MSFTIKCSLGEIIDKITILKIKQQKSKSIDQLYNINNELTSLSNKIDSLNLNNGDTLFYELFNVNYELWILEDKIRKKTKLKQYDDDFIICAKQIHINNDIRYNIKSKINKKYNSFIKEEKLYNTLNDNIHIADITSIQLSKNYYENGNFIDSYKILDNLIIKYNDCEIIDKNHFELLFSYLTICINLKKQCKIINKIEKIINISHIVDITKEYRLYIKFTYLFYLLNNDDYIKSKNYLQYMNYIIGPNVTYDNMSMITNSDDILLIYDSGGLGDKIMFSRLIFVLCEKYNNKIIYLSDKKIEWLNTHLFSNINNLHIVYDPNKLNNSKFTKHCSLVKLIDYLSMTTKDISNCYFPLFDNINTPNNSYLETIKNIIDENTYILNWKGNINASAELHNRRIELNNLHDLFMLKNIKFFIINKEISDDERKFLNKYSSVHILSDNIDNSRCFEDTIQLMKMVPRVITSDTSIAHVAANISCVKLYLLLSYGYEWRWGKNNCFWYPNIIKLVQSEPSNWTHVINKLKDIISL